MPTGASKNLHEVALSVNGDGDLIKDVRAAKDLGQHVELAAVANAGVNELADASDVVVALGTAEITPLVLR